jgi:hypothetical protein
MAIGGTVLSLVLGERSATLAQVSTDKGGRVVQRLGRFDAPSGTRLLDKPAESGAALAAYLGAHGFSSRKTVVGVPANWLIAQERDLPPIDANGAADLLRLAAERLSLAEAGTMVADYAGAPDSRSPSRVMLVGMLKPQLDRVHQFAAAAGLSVEGVCPTSLAVARVAGGDRSVLRLADDGAELVIQQNGTARSIQPLTADLAALGPEVKRTLAIRGVAGGDLVLADGIGITAQQQADLSSRLAKPPQPLGDVLGIRIDAAARNVSALQAAAPWPAIALAVAATDRQGLPVDFAHTKLAVRPPTRFGRRTILAAIAAVVVVGGFVWLFTTVASQEAREQELYKQVKDEEGIVKDARVVLDQLTYGRTYFDHRPPALECIKQVTLAFNYDEPIWASKISYNANGKCQLVGKVLNDRSNLIYEVRDRLMANPSFSNVSVPTQSEGGNKERLMTFSIYFNFDPKPAPAAASAKVVQK